MAIDSSGKIFSSRRGDKMKEYKITKEKILAMAEECPQVEEALKKGFPEAFEIKACCSGLKCSIREGLLYKDDSSVQYRFIKSNQYPRFCPFCREDLLKFYKEEV